MHLCLTCYRLWPREAILCGHCGRSFGGRLCPRRHLSPASARCCVHCGQTQLTAPTASLSLGWLVTLLVWGGVALACLWVWHLVQKPAFHDLRQALFRDLRQALFGCIVVWVLLALVPGSLGRQLRRSVTRLLEGMWRGLTWGLGYRLLRELVRGFAQVTGSDRRRGR